MLLNRLIQNKAFFFDYAQFMYVYTYCDKSETRIKELKDESETRIKKLKAESETRIKEINAETEKYKNEAIATKLRIEEMKYQQSMFA